MEALLKTPVNLAGSSFDDAVYHTAERKSVRSDPDRIARAIEMLQILNAAFDLPRTPQHDSKD